MNDRFQKLESLITHLPSVSSSVSSGVYENGFWWVKFNIDLSHSKAWMVIQMLAYTINYLSISERFSTVFYPLSPTLFNNDTSHNEVYWIIESTTQDFSPTELAVWLESRLPSANDL